MKSKYMIYTFLVTLLVYTAMINDLKAAAELTWGSKTFPEMKDEALEEAGAGVIHYELINDPDAFLDADIDYATIVDDTVIVCLEEKEAELFNVKDCIALYNIHGGFISGYKLKFDKKNGVYGVTLSNGDVLYFRSVYHCIYRLSGDRTEYYYAPSEYTGYLHSYHTISPYRLEYDRYKVDVTDQNGNTVRLIDHTADSFQKENIRQKKYQLAVVVDLFIVIACCAFLLIMRASGNGKK